MALPVQRVDEADALSHIVLRAAEIDARGAARLMRALIEMLLGVGEEIDAADEEGEAQRSPSRFMSAAKSVQSCQRSFSVQLSKAMATNCGGRSTAGAGCGCDG